MRWTLTKRISTCVVGVVALSVVSSLAALLSLWHVSDLLHQSINEHLPSVRAAGELEIAFLEQRGFVSSYILDNKNPRWLEKLKAREKNFDHWWTEANAASHTVEEREILKELEQVFQEYDAKRAEVIALHDRDETEAARELLVHDVNELYFTAYDLCEEFLEANVRFVDNAAANARWQFRMVAVTVSGCVALTIGLGAFLLWLFFYQVVFPFRALVADAQNLSDEPPPETEPLPIDEFRAVGVYLRSLMSDVTDQRTVLEHNRQRLSDAEKLASVGKLAASVAHEIRNPLTAIRMWLFSIQKEVGGDEGIDRKFGILSGEISRLEKIVRDFLDFARPPRLVLVPCSISQILDKTLELLGPRLINERIEIVRHDPGRLPLVNADEEQLRQVLLNLIENAVESVVEGGRICLSAIAEPEAGGRTEVVVRVADNRAGIPPDVPAPIIEPFFSNKEQGTGLGLCIAARIIAAHDGRLTLEASSQQGTTFAIRIPAIPAKRP